MRRPILKQELQQISHEEAISRVWGEEPTEVVSEGLWDVVKGATAFVKVAHKGMAATGQKNFGAILKDAFTKGEKVYDKSVKAKLNAKNEKNVEVFVKDTLASLVGGAQNYISSDPATKKLVDNWYTAPVYAKQIKDVIAQYNAFLQSPAQGKELETLKQAVMTSLKTLQQKILATDPKTMAAMVQQASTQKASTQKAESDAAAAATQKSELAKNENITTAASTAMDAEQKTSAAKSSRAAAAASSDAVPLVVTMRDILMKGAKTTDQNLHKILEIKSSSYRKMSAKQQKKIRDRSIVQIIVPKG